MTANQAAKGQTTKATPESYRRGLSAQTASGAYFFVSRYAITCLISSFESVCEKLVGMTGG